MCSMPIKFRCHHCQQLLGISRSRAGAVVDCPQCGRDLRVPELDGRTRRMPDAGAGTRTDSALISALSELSVLDQQDGAAVAVVATAADRPTEADVNDQLAVAVEPLPETEPVDVDVQWESPVVDAEPVAIHEYDGSTAESLAELATLHPHQSEAVVSDSLLDEMRSVSHPVGVSIASVIGAVCLLFVGLVAGWYLGRAKDGANLSLAGFVRQQGRAEATDTKFRGLPDLHSIVQSTATNSPGKL